MNYTFDFKGKSGEYFGIYIVNILLTVLTLGIYSAWAKVRTNQYFYGNTYVDGHNFGYHATGLQILIGRIIALVMIGLYVGVLQVFPVWGLLLVPVYILLAPLLIVRSMRFSNRMTSYRSVRFDFVGTYWRAFLFFILLPLANVFALYLLTPVISRGISEFVANNTRYGDRAFVTNFKLGKLYGVLITSLVSVIGLGGGALFALHNAVGLDIASADQIDAAVGSPIGIVVMAALYILIAVAMIVYAVVLHNLRMNSLVLDGKHHFKSTLPVAGYVWVLVSNFVVTVLSLTLLRPWAAVRAAKYVSQHTTLMANGSLADYSSQISGASSAVGEEFTDMEGFELGLGI